MPGSDIRLRAADGVDGWQTDKSPHHKGDEGELQAGWPRVSISVSTPLHPIQIKLNLVIGRGSSSSTGKLFQDTDLNRCMCWLFFKYVQQYQLRLCCFLLGKINATILIPLSHHTVEGKILIKSG